MEYCSLDEANKVKGSANNIGIMNIHAEKGSGSISIGNIKVYSIKSNLDNRELTADDIGILSDDLKNSDDISYSLDTLSELQKIGTEKIIPVIFDAIHDKSKSVSNYAIRILDKLHGKYLRPELYKGVLNDSYFVRSAAVNKLNKIGIKNEDITVYANKLLKGKDVQTKKGACTVLGELKSGTSAAISPLKITMMNTKNDLDLRLSALYSLWHINEDVIPLKAWTLALTSQAEHFYQLMSKAQDKLTSSGKLGVQPLSEALYSRDSEVRMRAIVDLEKIGSDAVSVVPDLLKRLEDNKWYISWKAEQALKTIAPGDINVKKTLAYVNHNKDSHNTKGKITCTQSSNDEIVSIDNGAMKIDIVNGIKVFKYIKPLTENNETECNNFQDNFLLYHNNYLNPRNKTKKPMMPQKAKFEIISQSDDIIELSFKFPATENKPYTTDIRYVIKKGDKGYYYYSILSKVPNLKESVRKNFENRSKINNNYDLINETVEGKFVSLGDMNKFHNQGIMSQNYGIPDKESFIKNGYKHIIIINTDHVFFNDRKYRPNHLGSFSIN